MATKIIAQQARASTFTIHRHFHHAAGRPVFSYIATGTRLELVEAGICKEEWFPEGAKRVVYTNVENGPAFFLKRLRGVYTFHIWSTDAELQEALEQAMARLKCEDPRNLSFVRLAVVDGGRQRRTYAPRDPYFQLRLVSDRTLPMGGTSHG